MPLRSAGLLIHRGERDAQQVLLVHPGGPFWKNKDAAAWSIPKGLVEPGEDEQAAALRETQEELGVAITGDFIFLGEHRQPGGKIVVAWSVAADPVLDLDNIVSSTFEMEWPPRSGVMQRFPEVDRASWFSLAEAENKIHKGQRSILQAFRSSGTG
jgi:predicted NUDIX family NTP pyrophosphohydrolase